MIGQMAQSLLEFIHNIRHNITLKNNNAVELWLSYAVTSTSMAYLAAVSINCDYHCVSPRILHLEFLMLLTLFYAESFIFLNWGGNSLITHDNFKVELSSIKNLYFLCFSQNVLLKLYRDCQRIHNYLIAFEIKWGDLCIRKNSTFY